MEKLSMEGNDMYKLQIFSYFQHDSKRVNLKF